MPGDRAFPAGRAFDGAPATIEAGVEAFDLGRELLYAQGGFGMPLLPRWRARYPGPDIRERSQAFARRVDAERWLAGVTVSTAKGEWIDPALGRVTFAEWTEHWAPTIVDLRPNTLSRDLGMVRTHLIPAFGPVPLAELTTVDVAAWVAAQTSAGRLAPATVRKAGQILAKIMRSAVDSGLIARPPYTSVKPPAEGSREMRFLYPAELIALVDAIKEHYRVLVLTAAHAGLRWGELAGLRVARVDPLRRAVMVVDQLAELDGRLSFGPPKTAASRRSVSLPSFLVQALSEQIGGRARAGGSGLPGTGRRPHATVELPTPSLVADHPPGRPRRPPFSRSAAYRRRPRHRPGRARQGHPGAHGPQLGDGDSRPVRAPVRGS